MSEDCMLTTEDVEESFVCGNRSIVAMDIHEENSRNIGLFREWLDAHDRALREQIARAIEAKADDPDPTLEPQYFMAMDIAARIARGEDQ